MTSTASLEYDGVALIDALPEDERASFQLAHKLSQRLNRHRIMWQGARCGHKADVLAAFGRFAELADGIGFVLHIISHGSEEGLWVKATNEHLYWSELTPYLERMNRGMGGGLVLNMTTCYGLHSIKVVDPDAPTLPVFGVIGAKQDLDVLDAARANEILYDRLASGGDIPRIVEEVNHHLKADVIFCITGIGYRAIKQVVRRHGGTRWR